MTTFFPASTSFRAATWWAKGVRPKARTTPAKTPR